MPFSSQPRKKGTGSPQAAQTKPSCGHTTLNKSCPACGGRSKVVKIPTTKNEIYSIREKISNKFIADNKTAEKAATILSLWINKTPTKKQK